MTGPRPYTEILKILRDISVQPRWMKLKQAAKYSSLGQKELIRLAKKRKIDGFQDLTKKTKPWIFDKKSIDDYIILENSQEEKNTDKRITQVTRIKNGNPIIYFHSKLKSFEMLDPGYIYIASNKCFIEKFIKIGFTRKDPYKRIHQLSQTSIPTPFELEYVFYVDDCRKYEAHIHGELDQFRVQKNKEFFKLSSYAAAKVIIDNFVFTDMENLDLWLKEKETKEMLKEFEKFVPATKGK